MGHNRTLHYLWTGNGRISNRSGKSLSESTGSSTGKGIGFRKIKAQLGSINFALQMVKDALIFLGIIGGLILLWRHYGKVRND
jgi:hypothetical protein